ncbi:MAG: AAA family ATPase [Candidatus Thiodiazotropha endolucinida]|nr:AAA family ATPase [Candidatus Thiodiazotropha taylori]MCW4330825.1 AAA family ATPase [Candidatus Thiodiazotropha endolucinida]MCG8058440.1 AAA family ATPase [Candidatus Thiodiazotropha taylori]MCG8064735.1 AAA family ATPase [Candidatus Thiodiazotropha taylori]MCW4344763.1 AAA family ATPase [Candidatus Thiodiazotropha endolucinida]
MTIERIERISNYRIYRDFRWSTELLDFSRYNLFYGWNGSGKTTLSSIFDALQSHRTIASSDVRLHIDGSTVHGNDFENVTLPNIRVFNRDTVDRTLFEEPHRELPPVYYLGEESAEKQREVVRLKEELESTNKELGKNEQDTTTQQGQLEKFCTEYAANIKNLLTASGGGPYNNYDKRLFKQDAENILNGRTPGFCLTEKEKERCIEKKNGTPLDKLFEVVLPTINYESLVNQTDTLLSQSIVSSVIEELKNSPIITSWVQQGLKLHTGDNESKICHFCKQELPDSRVAELEAHFNDQLSGFQDDIDQLIRQIESHINQIDGFSLPAKSLLYPHLRDDYEKSTYNWNSTKLSLIHFLQSLVAALKRKRDEPFQRLDIKDVVFSQINSSEDSGWIMKILTGILNVAQNVMTLLGLQTISKINQIISQHNKYTDDFSDQVTQSRKELALDIVSRTITDYQNLKSEIKQLEQTTSTLQENISHKNREIDNLERDILEHRKAADELNEEMCAYLGREELKFEISDNGYRITRNGEPALHLSEGERTAISFMYFLKTLEDEDFNLEEGIVVIDDPISSLDANSLYSAFGFMKEKTKDAKQLFILTHSFSFFRLVRGWFLKMPHMMKITKPHLHPARLYLLGPVNTNFVKIIG